MGLFSRRKSIIRGSGEWRKRPAGLPRGFERRRAARQKGGFFERLMNPPKPSSVKELKQEENPVESFFGSKQKPLVRSKLRKRLKKAPRKVPGFGKPYEKKERIEMEEKEFPKEKYGLFIDPKEFEKWKKEKEKHPGQTIGEKLETKRKLKFWQELIKKKPAA